MRVQPQANLKLLDGRAVLMRLRQCIRQAGVVFDGIGVKLHRRLEFFDRVLPSDAPGYRQTPRLK